MTQDEIIELACQTFGGVIKKEERDNFIAFAKLIAEKERVQLRRGDVLRCNETDELCTVWFTSTTGKTLVKWRANDFGEYTSEQIGELFWLEPMPDDIELAAVASDNETAFYAGYRFAVAHATSPQNGTAVDIANLIREKGQA